MLKKQFKIRLILIFGLVLIILAAAFFYLPMILGDVVYPLPPEYAKMIREESSANDISPSFASAVAFAESGFHSTSVSGAGAVGLFQLMPGTAYAVAKRHGISTKGLNLKDPATSAKLGILHLRELMDMYSSLDDYNQMKATLIAYNAGSGVADAWIKGGKQDKYLSRGVSGYANKILRLEQIYRESYAVELGMEPINLQAETNAGQRSAGATTFWVDLLSRTINLKL